MLTKVPIKKKKKIKAKNKQSNGKEKKQTAKHFSFINLQQLHVLPKQKRKQKGDSTEFS